MEALGITYEFVWGTALGVVPLAILAAIAGVFLRERPAARHVLWMSVLASLVTPVVLGVLGMPRLVDVDGLVDGTAVGAAPVERDRAMGRPVRGPDVPYQVGLQSGERELVASPAQTFIANPGALAERSEAIEAMKDLAEMPVLGAAREGGGPSTDESPDEGVAWAGIGAGGVVGAEERSWRHAAGSAVDAIRAVPPMPRWLWAGGAALFGLVLVRQLARLVLVVRESRPAPAETQALVRMLSGRLGLGRVPMAMIVDRSISPMISCGLKPRVILPSRLWNELDLASREAVLVHELAHLRRRDHVVCWVETLLGVMYWWHPVVWWVRRRLHEDADLCCDAWVVSLFPRHRRAYAEALVTTRGFVGGGSARAVALGLGMASPRVRRFSRRLSMVMTRRLSPRASGVGLLLAVSALGAGAMLTPAIACPPEDKGAQKELIRLHHQAGQAVAALHEAQAAAGASRGVRALERALAAQRVAPPSRGGVGVSQDIRERAIAALTSTGGSGVTISSRAQPEHGRSMEERIARLEARVDRLLALLERGGGSAGVAAPTPQRATAEWPIVEQDVVARGETTERAYRLPEGKLDALWALMARQDVPVFVSRGQDGSIIVHGDARQQGIFAAFVAMIHPEGATAEGAAAAIGAGELAIAQERLARVYEEAARRANEGNALRGRAEDLDRRREIEMQRKAMHAERQILQRRIETMKRKAEQLFERSETVRERAEEIEAAAEEAEGERAEQLRAQADRLARQADELEEEAEALEHEGDALEEMLDEYEDRIEEFEAEADGGDDGAEQECEEAEETENGDERI